MSRPKEHSISYRQAAKMNRVVMTWNAVDSEDDPEKKAALKKRAVDEGVPRQVAHDYATNDRADSANPGHQGPKFYWPDGQLKTPEEFARTLPPEPEPPGSDAA